MTGQEVRKLRESMNLTQGAFAKLLGLKSYYWISRIENERFPVSDRVKVICEMMKDKLVSQIK